MFDRRKLLAGSLASLAIGFEADRALANLVRPHFPSQRAHRPSSWPKDVALRNCPNDTFFATFSPNGMQVVTAAWDSARVWDALTGQQLNAVAIPKGSSWRKGLSGDGSRLILTTREVFFRVWDGLTGDSIAAWRAYEDDEKCYPRSLSADGSRVILISRDNWRLLSVRDTKTNSDIAVLRSNSDFCGASFSPADPARIIATTWHDSVQHLWESAKGTETIVLRGHEDFTPFAAFSRDGTKILTASEDNTVRIWDMTGTQLKILDGHDDKFFHASLSVDGTRIVATSWRSRSLVWDAVTGRELAVLPGHDENYMCAALSPDGTRVVTVCPDKSIRIVRVPT